MYITRLRLKNWRNFRAVDISLREVAYIIGPNASGKSNLLDSLRFLKDVAKADGGGVQRALSTRGGVSRVRCLHARKDPEVRIEIEVAYELDQTAPTWVYILGLRNEGKGAHRSLISSEIVKKDGRTIVSRPDDDDSRDPARLTQTSLEQIQANGRFRELAEFLADISFVHLVPQLLKYSDQIGGNRIEDDPFGQGFLERVARETARTRNSRLKRIEGALKIAVPQFSDLRFNQDLVTGRPHLEARYEHYRPNAGWQREDSFSDGTLRLIALLWSLQAGDSVLLMEEPELSLNDSIVREIPVLLSRVRPSKRRQRQIFVTTHSEALLANEGIDSRHVVLLEVEAEGTTARLANEAEQVQLDAGFSPAEVLLSKAKAPLVGIVPLWAD
ncbi:putative ATPase [Rathayibacter agropyri]|nr:AAA family ATPase [Rathayibacter agropyri]